MPTPFCAGVACVRGVPCHHRIARGSGGGHATRTTHTLSLDSKDCAARLVAPAPLERPLKSSVLIAEILRLANVRESECNGRRGVVWDRNERQKRFVCMGP